MTRRALVLVLALLAVAGCEEDVDPTLGLDAPFTLYGYLDPTASRQALRVVPVRPQIDAPDSLDATVTSTDLATGVVTAWRDSLVTFSNGSSGHVFVADLTPAPNSAVRVEVSSPDGATARVDVDVPPLVEPRLVGTTGLGSSVIYRVAFDGAPSLLNGQLRLRVRGLPFVNTEGTIVVTEGVQPRRLANGTWVADIPFASAVRDTIEGLGLLDDDVQLVSVEYVGFVTDAAWNPPTRDFELLAEPGVFTNVEGGLGYVGGGLKATLRWLPSISAQVASGLFPAPTPPGGLEINEVQAGPGGWVELHNPTINPIDLAGHSISPDDSRPRLVALSQASLQPGEILLASVPEIAPGTVVRVYDRFETVVAALAVTSVAGGATLGRFPDGLAAAAPGGVDPFLGPTVPTPGAPNALGLDVATLNEVVTEGESGVAEVVGLDPRFAPTDPVLFDDPRAFGDAVAASRIDFGTAPETPGVLRLPQIGGRVYLAVRFQDGREPGAPARPRVVDVRDLGPQTPGRASGRLPDATGPWTLDLRPTPGAPNARARLGL